jgi:hypothetical protein
MVVDIATALPNGVQNAIQSNWEVVNHPTAGVFDNYMAPNVQLNISTVRYRGGKGTKRGTEREQSQY